MANISNISDLRHIDKKKLHKKMSFSKGEIIRAKIKGVDGQKIVQLKTSDGWEFQGEVEKALDDELLGKFLKFQIKGIKDGKLQLKIVQKESNEGGEKSSLDNLIQKLGLKKDVKTVELLKMMIKLKMPLSKENVSQMKSLVQFQETIKNSPVEKEKFLNKLLDNLNINKDSEGFSPNKGRIMSFLNGLEKLDSKSLMFMFKNKITLSGGNIEAFRNISSGKTSVMNLLSDLSSSIEKENDIINNLEFDFKGKVEDSIVPKEITNKNSLLNAVNNYTSKESEQMDFVEKMLADILKESSGEELKQLKELGDKIGIKEFQEKESVGENKDVKENGTAKENETVKSQLNGKTVLKNSINPETAKRIKEVITETMKDSKEVIKMLLAGEDGEGELSDKVGNFIQKNMNNFKVFNSMNSEYYYFDNPLKFKEEEYPLKFIIKDERKKEKKIDSKNVKMVVSLTTKNIGVVDAFIKIKNQNINIELKCDSKWKNIFMISKEKLIEKFDDRKHNLKVSVEEKKEEVNIVNCNEFFEDRELMFLDVKA